MKMRGEGQFQEFSEAFQEQKSPTKQNTLQHQKRLMYKLLKWCKKREQTIHVHEWINDEYRNTVTSLS